MRIFEVMQDRGPEPKPGDHAVFIQKGGKWDLWYNYGANKSGAEQERDYFAKSLGVPATIFTKK